MKIELITQPTDLILQPCTDPYTGAFNGLWRRTLKPISIVVSGMVITVPAGFHCDQGSVPKWARCFIDGNDESLLGFIVHDYLYKKDTQPCTRKYADRALYDIALACGQDRVEAWITYACVVLCGKHNFNKLDVYIDNA